MTKKQWELLNFVSNFIEGNGFSPSFEEMKDVLGWKSKSRVHEALGGLERSGRIVRLHRRARSIEVVEDPHIPQSISSFSLEDLANEVERRGLILGQIMSHPNADGTERRTVRQIRF